MAWLQVMLREVLCLFHLYPFQLRLPLLKPTNCEQVSAYPPLCGLISLNRHHGTLLTCAQTAQKCRCVISYGGARVMSACFSSGLKIVGLIAIDFRWRPFELHSDVLVNQLTVNNPNWKPDGRLGCHLVNNFSRAANASRWLTVRSNSWLAYCISQPLDLSNQW